jgi:hypothetical protein
VKVEPGGRRRVALGLCESYKPAPGRRVQELRVEGAPAAVVDPLASGKQNVPVVVMFDACDEDADGWLTIEAHSSGPDPNVMLNGFWVFPAGERINAEEVINGEGTRRAEIAHSCGTERESVAPAPRPDAIVAEFSPSGLQPQVVVRTRRRLTKGSPIRGARSTVLSFGPDPYLFSSPMPAVTTPTSEGWLLEYKPGTQRIEIVLVHGNHGPAQVVQFPSLTGELAATRSFWQNTFRPGRGRISVPDPAVQLLVETSVRTLYQVRENVDGIRQFQPGPTVYRGLWLADVILTGVSVTLLGDTAAMREFLETGFRFQQPSGQARILYPSESLPETITWVFASLWYARTTNDSLWLSRRWTELSRGLDWICSLRRRSLASPQASYAGLLPPGFVDGGISTPMSDYGTLWWAMIALEEGIRAASWLHTPERSGDWKRTLEGFGQSFTVAARRDIRRDALGNIFLPVGVGDTSVTVPQKGQYAIVLPIRHGGWLFAPGSLADSVARMNLRMFDSYIRQGLLVSSGWLLNGVWPWLGGVIGIAHQQLGNSSRAAEFLHAYAQHASPTGVWVEEQLVREAGPTTTGDVSDAEASAVFLHLVRYLLATERGDDFELFGGLPPDWIAPGARTALHNVLSEFGEFSAELQVSADGGSARIFVSAIDGRGSSGRPVLVLRALRDRGFVAADGKPLPETLPWSWKSELVLELRR